MTDKFQSRMHLVSSSFYVLYVFLSVFSLSSWNLLYGDIFTISNKFMLIIMLLLLTSTLLNDWTLTRLISVIILFLLSMMYYHIYKANYFTFVLFAVIIGSGMDFNQIIKLDLFARSVTVLIVIFLSLLSILPASGSNAALTSYAFTSFTYGFTYPNILGYLLIIIIIDLCCYLKNNVKVVIISIILGIALEYIIGYATGMLSLLIFIFLYFILRQAKGKKITFFLLINTLLIPFFTILTVFIGKNYNSTIPVWDWISKALSLRPPIWQYYLKSMPISTFGTLRTINQYTLGVIGSGAFDGAYIVFLLQFGLFSLILLFLLMLYLTFKKAPQSLKMIICCYLAVTVFSDFPETLGFLTTYSPFFFLVGSLLFHSNNKSMTS